jgi:hypothetical protein
MVWGSRVSLKTQSEFRRAGIPVLLGAYFGIALSGCAESDALEGDTCTATFEGTPWVPEISGAGDCNHNDTNASTGVQISKWTYTNSGIVLTGLGNTLSGRIVTVPNIPVTDDLLTNGSLTLVAETTGFPSSLQGSAWPVLISLHDGTNELVGMEAGCANGFFTCSGSTCSARTTGCEPDPAGTAGTAYLGNTALKRRQNWETHQGIYFDPNATKFKFGLIMDSISVNTFPTCNWASGTPTCHFNSAPGSFFSSGKLRTGTYTAKYVLLADSYTSVPTSMTAGLKVTAVKKRDGNNGAGNGCNSVGGHKGSVDLNVILVGDRNIADSRTAKGKQNLNALFQHVYDQLYTQNISRAGIRLGKVTVYEWSCTAGGETYANTSDYSALFQVGSRLMPAESEGKALNVFLVSTVAGSTSILGLSGGIGGPPVNGTMSSGLVFASFNKLANFNPNCSGSGTCALSSQEASFIDMGGTITHEIGHYLGLNHLSESDGTIHDPVPDTPPCTNTASTTAGLRLTLNSCRMDSSTEVTGNSCSSQCGGYNGATVFCSSAVECQFNHVMWYTTKNYGSDGTGDGNIISTNSGTVINYNPLVQ